MKRLFAFLLAALPSCAALAADALPDVQYALLSKTVKFSAPGDWSAILQKTEGMPQFYVFQVKNPADANNERISEIQVEARSLNDASTYQALVNAGTDKAKQTPGFELLDTKDGVMRYTGLDDKQRYEYRETWIQQDSRIFLHVRCSRPLLDATTPAWITAYEAGCAQVMRTIRQH